MINIPFYNCSRHTGHVEIGTGRTCARYNESYLIIIIIILTEQQRELNQY